MEVNSVPATLMKRKLFIPILGMLITACATSQRDVFKQDQAILDELRQGGFVIYFAHAAADDKNLTSIIRNNTNDCSTQSQLNGLGRTQAKVIGKSFRKLKIPFSDVHACQLCPCINTGKLAFGQVRPSPEITTVAGTEHSELQNSSNILNSMIGNPPPAGSNTIIIGNSALLDVARKIVLEEGEAAIFKPGNDGAAEFISQVKANGWQTLVSRLSEIE